MKVRSDVHQTTRSLTGSILAGIGLTALLSTNAAAHDEKLSRALAENDRDLYYHIPENDVQGELYSDQIYAGPFDQALGLAFDPAGRLWVWEKKGKIWHVKADGTTAPAPMLDLTEEVGDWGAHGMLGVAFDIGFAFNGVFYVFYVVDHHHLVHFGQPSYDPGADEYFVDTIARITRYELVNPFAAPAQMAADPSSRVVLVGEDSTSGFPVCSTTHGVGTLAMGEDGSLLASYGDGYLSNTGSGTCHSEGLITDAENVQNFRAQLVNSMAGKLLRMDSLTGDGLPDNPFYNPLEPRSPASRVWSMGLRQPYRLTVRPGSGSPTFPGVIYIGDVGAQVWEELNLATQPGQNFGWPVFAGMDLSSFYFALKTANLDAPNPLFGQTIPGVGLCEQEFFDFQELIHQDVIGALDLPNPCDPSAQVPLDLQHEHLRPILAWKHDEAVALTKTFTGGEPATEQLGEPGTLVAGESFAGNAAIGGVWYTGLDFPSLYQNSYFMGDYGEGWIKCLRFDAQNRLDEVISFSEDAGGPVAFATHPTTGGLYYIDYTHPTGSVVRKISFVGNLPPVAVATASATFGPSPLSVLFEGDDSSDPEGSNLSYEWDFGDGSPTSSLPNPSHVFSVVGPDPAVFQVTLTVMDEAGLEDTVDIAISLNNTHPSATILAPANGTTYSSDQPDVVTLTSSASDAEFDPGELTCTWEVVLYHDNHTHPEPLDDACQSSAVVAPHTTDGDVEYYEVRLTVSDPAGLTDTVSHWMPREDDCNVNGFPDSLDILLSISDDLNSNGTPDECESDCDFDGLQDFFATDVGAVADCNNNHVPDSCDIALGTSLDLDFDGTPDECEELSVDVPSVSVSAGGTQNLALDAGAEFAGDLYWVLGSLTGTTPATPFGPVFLPLASPDSYFDWTLFTPTAGPLVDSVGFLDAAGMASPSVVLGPGNPPAWAGLTVYHAAIVVDLNLLGFEGIELATNPVTLLLDP